MPDNDSDSIEIASLLREHDKQLSTLGVELLNGNAQRISGALAALVTTVATRSPALGAFANEAVQKAFVAPATRRLIAEVEQYDQEKEREALIGDIRAEVEALVGQALVQLVRVQHNVKNEILEALGGLPERYASFREEFQVELDRARSVAMQVPLLEVSGGIGVRISANAKNRMIVEHAKVTGGVGFVLE